MIRVSFPCGHNHVIPSSRGIDFLTKLRGDMPRSLVRCDTCKRDACAIDIRFQEEPDDHTVAHLLPKSPVLPGWQNIRAKAPA